MSNNSLNYDSSNEEILFNIIKDPALRKKLAYESHIWFFNVYLNHYVQYATADFQKEIFSLTEDQGIRTLSIVAFRGSGKSTIITMSLPIWAILGKQQIKFIVILGKTQQQAKQLLKNLKAELEHNELLKAELGPFEEEEDEWNSYSIVLPKFGARITAASFEQSIRGIRHEQHRPQLIICDDIEDLSSVSTLESRDKTYRHLTSEVIPAGSSDTRLILVGNLLHEDSLIKRINKSIASGEMDGTFREYPLTNENNECLWPGKYPTPDHLESERKRIGSEVAWKREYLLEIVTDRERVIYPEWILSYDEIPPLDEKHGYIGAFTAIDLAISQRESADRTAMVSCYVFGRGKEFKIYILPNIVNDRLTHLETLQQAKNISSSICIKGKGKLYIEEVGYQGSITEHLRKDGYPAEGVPIRGQDKRGRLVTISHLIQDGTVLFPKRGAESLIQQLTGFGVERFDDLADAFSMLISKVMHLRTYSTFNWGSHKDNDNGTITGNLYKMRF